jgi:hypothetical protein
MRAHRLVLSITLLLLSARAEANPLNWAFHAIEGPFTSLDQYCQRFAQIAGSCAFTNDETPAPFGEFRSIRIARVQAHRQLGLDWLLLVVATDKGLFVDDRLMLHYAGLGKGDAVVAAVAKETPKSGEELLLVRLRGRSGAPSIAASDRADFVRADGSYDEDTLCAGDGAGVIRCMDPGTILLNEHK